MMDPNKPDVIDLHPVDGVYVPLAGADHGPPRGANSAFMQEHPAHWIALGFGSGLAPFAPGTFGTLWGWLVWTLIQPWLTPLQLGLVIALALPLGWWASTVTARHLGVADPGCVVWDEVVAIWIILWLLLPASAWSQIIAVVLFRYFDAAKPGPVRWANQLFKGFGWRGGLGIMLDDLVAAFCTLMVIALWRWWF